MAKTDWFPPSRDLLLGGIGLLPVLPPRFHRLGDFRMDTYRLGLSLSLIGLCLGVSGTAVFH